jgi:electron transfer flavoprotein alpha subunit
MAGLEIIEKKCTLCGVCRDVCPFQAIEITNGRVLVGSGCKMCKICIKKCPAGAIVLNAGERKAVRKEDYSGIAVFVEHFKGKIHPVTIELLGKAKELSLKVPQKIFAVFIGSGVETAAETLLHYGADRVYVYDDEALEHFRVDLYAKRAGGFYFHVNPSIVMVGATSVGRSLAPGWRPAAAAG